MIRSKYNDIYVCTLKRICWKYFNYMRQRLGYKPKKTHILWLQPSLALQKSWFLYKQYWSIILTAFDQFIIYFLEKKSFSHSGNFPFYVRCIFNAIFFHLLFKREKYIASLFLHLKKLIFKTNFGISCQKLFNFFFFHDYARISKFHHWFLIKE